jgi:hypothetical protein
MVTIYDSASSLPGHLAGLLDEVRLQHHDWINNIEGSALQTQHEQMTIYGPFGGRAARPGDDFAASQRRARYQFQGGSGDVELVQMMESGDMVVLVMLEASEVNFAGQSSARPWVLRTTQVYQRTSDGWARLHRHADPLIKRRDLEETLSLLD